MNLRNWGKYHTFGLILGFLGPLIYIPLIIFILSRIHNTYFDVYMNMFFSLKSTQGKFISLAIIPNLLWFFLFLNREKYNTAMGIIVGSALYLPYIIYINFVK